VALKIFSSQTLKGKRPPFEAAYAYFFSLLLGFFVADLAVVSVRPSMLPTKAPPSRPVRMTRMRNPDISLYSGITKRNIFSPDKKIPPALTGDGSDQNSGNDVAPVLSQLGLSLEGTLVSSNPKHSVATINIKARNETSAFSVDHDIRGMARITAIERRRVVFRNLSNHRLEYIEIPKDSQLTLSGVKPTPTGEVQGDGHDFTMNRADINKYISNLGQVLNQARMVPNIVPGTGGKVEGFRFVSIQPGSIYEKLGFKPMDVIKSVNGEAVNSPTKAMELYNALRTENQIGIVVERGGRDENMNYTIPQ
jgi:general secretion pathway protein C